MRRHMLGIIGIIVAVLLAALLIIAAMRPTLRALPPRPVAAIPPN